MNKNILLSRIKVDGPPTANLEDVAKLLAEFIGDKDIIIEVDKYIKINSNILNNLQRHVGVLEYKLWKYENSPSVTTVTTKGANLITYFLHCLHKIHGLMATSPWWRTK